MCDPDARRDWLRAARPWVLDGLLAVATAAAGLSLLSSALPFDPGRRAPGPSTCWCWPLAALTAGADRTVRVRTPEPEALLLAGGATVAVDGPDRLAVGGVTTEQVGQAAAAGGVVLHEMRFERSNLEDVFLELTGGKGDPR